MAMNWKIGQKLVCVERIKWSIGYGPNKDDVVTIHSINHLYGAIYFQFYEYRNSGGPCYCSIYFRPAIGPSAKSELIEKFVEVEEKSDCPIQVPETV